MNFGVLTASFIAVVFLQSSVAAVLRFDAKGATDLGTTTQSASLVASTVEAHSNKSHKFSESNIIPVPVHTARWHSEHSADPGPVKVSEETKPAELEEDEKASREEVEKEEEGDEETEVEPDVEEDDSDSIEPLTTVAAYATTARPKQEKGDKKKEGQQKRNKRDSQPAKVDDKKPKGPDRTEIDHEEDDLEDEDHDEDIPDDEEEGLQNEPDNLKPRPADNTDFEDNLNANTDDEEPGFREPTDEEMLNVKSFGLDDYLGEIVAVVTEKLQSHDEATVSKYLEGAVENKFPERKCIANIGEDVALTDDFIDDAEMWIEFPAENAKGKPVNVALACFADQTPEPLPEEEPEEEILREKPLVDVERKE